MIQRFTYLGNVTIEHVRDGDSEEWNVYPQEPPLAPEPVANGPESTPVAAPLGDLPLCAAPVYTKKARGLMGGIRAAWFLIFSGAGEAVQYLIDNLTGLGLPPRTGAAVGAALYGAKRAIWPDSKI